MTLRRRRRRRERVYRLRLRLTRRRDQLPPNHPFWSRKERLNAAFLWCARPVTRRPVSLRHSLMITYRLCLAPRARVTGMANRPPRLILVRRLTTLVLVRA